MPSPVPYLLPVAAVLLVLTGCDPAVQARYQPTSVDEVFGPFSRISGVEAEVHELPAAPPALDATEAHARVCRPPGLTLKPTDMVGLRDDTPRITRIEPTALVASYEPPLPSPPPGPAYRIASWNQHEIVGAKEPISTPPYAPDLEPGHSVYRNPPILTGSYRRDIYSWCYPAANLR